MKYATNKVLLRSLRLWCAIWHRQLWIKRKTFRCPYAHRAKLPHQYKQGWFSTRYFIRLHDIKPFAALTVFSCFLCWNQSSENKVSTCFTLTDQNSFEMSEVLKKSHSELYSRDLFFMRWLSRAGGSGSQVSTWLCEQPGGCEETVPSPRGLSSIPVNNQSLVGVSLGMKWNPLSAFSVTVWTNILSSILDKPAWELWKTCSQQFKREKDHSGIDLPAVMLVASFGSLHGTVAACLRTCFWRQALETKSASAVRGKVGRWVCECVCVRERKRARERLL